MHYFIFVTVTLRYVYILKHREKDQLESHLKQVVWYVIAIAYITFAKTYESDDLLGSEFGLFKHWLLRGSRLMIFDFMRMDEDCFTCFNRCKNVNDYSIF